MAVIAQEIGERFAAYNGDCVEVLPGIKDGSIHLSVYSPPFAELYNYSSSDRDMSNCRDYGEFLEHYEFLVRQIFRATMTGRISAVHCMDLKKGADGQRDFPGDIVRIHERAGFEFHSRRTIWKEPLRVAIRTRSKGLMHRQIVKDSTLCRCAGADYILTFRKPGTNPEPVENPNGLSRYAGETQVPPDLLRKFAEWEDPKTNKLSHWIWQRYASSVWMDIRAGRVMPYKAAREKEDEKHVCPLQLDVIERIVVLHSNPGDVVLTPFMGVGSEVYGALVNGRRGIGVELKPSYYRQAVRNIKAALENRVEGEADLCDMAEAEAIDEDGIENEPDSDEGDSTELAAEA